MGSTSRWRSPWLIVAVLALIGAGVVTATMLRGGDEQGHDDGKPTAAAGAAAAQENPRARRLKARSAQLKRMLATQREDEAAPERTPIDPALRQHPEHEGPIELTPTQRAALAAAFRRFYSAQELADVLRSGDAAEYTREVAGRFAETLGGDTIEGARGAVPVTGELRRVIARVAVVRDYTFNVLHSQRPAGQEDRQAEMIERINASFAARFDALNRDYPFLGAELVRP